MKKKSKNLIFSTNEQKVLKILGRRKMTIRLIMCNFYGDDWFRGCNNNIAALIRRINFKCEQHGLLWFLNGKGTGRAGKTVWREKCKR